MARSTKARERPEDYPVLTDYKPTKFMLLDSHYDAEKADRAVRFIENLCHAVLSIWDNVKNGINDRLGSVKSAVTNAMNSVYQAVMDKVNSSWSWGRDLMQNLINGITYMIGNLILPTILTSC